MVFEEHIVQHSSKTKPTTMKMSFNPDMCMKNKALNAPTSVMLGGQTVWMAFVRGGLCCLSLRVKYNKPEK